MAILINPWLVIGRDGKFLSLTYRGTISAENATTLGAEGKPETDPAVSIPLSAPENKVWCITSYNFGATPREKVYFSIVAVGYPLPTPLEVEALLLDSNREGQIFLPSTRCYVRLWNITSPPSDVDYEITLFIVEISREFLKTIYYRGRG